MIALPSKTKLYFDSDGQETRVLASGGRNEGDENDRVFLQLLADTAACLRDRIVRRRAVARALVDHRSRVPRRVLREPVRGDWRRGSVRAAIAGRSRDAAAATFNTTSRSGWNRQPQALSLFACASPLFPGHLARSGEVGQHHAGAQDHRGQRILGDEHRQAGLLAQPLVEVAQQRAAAGQDDAAVVDVGGQLGRNPLERVAHRLDDLAQRLGQRFADFGVGDGDGPRHALDQRGVP